MTFNQNVNQLIIKLSKCGKIIKIGQQNNSFEALNLDLIIVCNDYPLMDERLNIYNKTNNISSINLNDDFDTFNLDDKKIKLSYIKQNDLNFSLNILYQNYTNIQ